MLSAENADFAIAGMRNLAVSGAATVQADENHTLHKDLEGILEHVAEDNPEDTSITTDFAFWEREMEHGAFLCSVW